MELKDLNRYACIAGGGAKEMSNGEFVLFDEVQAMDAAHRHQEYALLEALLAANRMIKWIGMQDHLIPYDQISKDRKIVEAAIIKAANGEL